MYNVLIVDDEQIILQGLNFLIDWEEHGLEIAGQAANGLDALELIKNQTFHILITDIKMPKMNGIELLEEVKRLGKNIKTIVLSGYDDFQYVKSAMKLGIEDYLLKPVNEEELSSTLQRTVDKIEIELSTKMFKHDEYNILKENILNRWVTNSIRTNELIERANLLNINIDVPYYMVCIIKTLNSSLDKKDMTAEEKYLAAQTVSNVCNEAISTSKITFINLSYDVVIVFTLDKELPNTKSIKPELEACMKSICDRLDIDVFITVGNVVKGLSSTYKSYENASLLLDYCLVEPPNSIIGHDEIKSIQNDNFEHYNINFSKLRNYIQMKNVNELLSYIDEIYANLGNIPGIEPANIRNISIDIIYTIISIARTLYTHSGIKQSPHGDILSRLYEIETLSELCSWVKTSVCDILESFASGNINKNPLINRVIKYIDDYYYSEDISLKTLSSICNTNATYLGRLFKNETGEMFTNYLNRYRVEKAKELISSTKLSVREIAEKVGCTNVNYFYSVFQKYTGVYPKEYKRSMIDVSHSG